MPIVVQHHWLTARQKLDSQCSMIPPAAMAPQGRARTVCAQQGVCGHAFDVGESGDGSDPFASARFRHPMRDVRRGICLAHR
jgi:hypothetical protein